MNDSLVYNIPAKMVDDYSGRNLIVRSASPNEIVYSFWRAEQSAIRYAQLLSLDCDASILEGTGEGIPLEIVLKSPDCFEQLYNFRNLSNSHPLRIAISVVPGFGKAVKLATDLGCAVKLQIEQPGESLVEEIESVLDFYLHLSNVRHPIEFFQSLLLSFYRSDLTTLWDINEENPEQVRYVTDAGEETIASRFVGVRIDGGLSYFVERLGHKMLIEERQCHACEFFSRCKGYFKWPDPTYRCDAIKRIFMELKHATQDARKDHAAYESIGAHA